ncbi:DUF6616 family protein [Microvirgula aerodenitrificans]|uniref:Uncharacterized protein n=1 Tax=Microvirgula aerodenitrificans TaxID=57480 RepID=A0A2S0PCD1_9NEIS|nr:DUF6616 family protein [Microvirgula aerodenitrificans]AVY94983.1 hypothetical protein DAI18_13720 [Microvirgula aerodenitrificans]
MAHYLAELYSPKPAWLALDPAGRQRFFDGVGAGMGALMALGVEVLAMGEVEAGSLHPAPQRFFALWRLADQAALDALLGGIAASGWHDYFDTVNAGGRGTDLGGHLAQLAAVA